MSNETPEAATAVKLSPVEGIKDASQWLRGTLREELQGESDHFGSEMIQLLKFHGSYQQEDRDARKNRAKAGTGKHYMFMIRLKLPGGKLSGAQYLVLDDLCERYANGTIRLTTRQSVQFHGILKTDLKSTLAEMNSALMTTLGGCGDVNRNVMACPAPTGDAVRVEMQTLADDVARHLTPHSNAYHDVWLNGEGYSADAEAEDVEPIYGKVYLPRKFKIGFSMPYDNCVDVYAQDLGFLAVVENGKTVGYNALVGGGMGRSNSKPETFAQLGYSMFFVEPDRVVDASEQVIKFYRDHGNRADRKRARIKYVVHDWGVDKVRKTLARDYFGHALAEPREATITDVSLHHGWNPQGDGKWFLGLSVESGRIHDVGTMRLRTALRAIVSKYNPDVRITAQQDILLCNISTADRTGVDAMLGQHGIERPENLSMMRRWSMACPAIPTCGLAITESERALPSVTSALAEELAAMGMAQERMSIRMTGCPNGCARPYQSEIGLVGRSGEKYTLYVGGSSLGTRLNYPLADMIHRDKVVETLRPLLGRWKSDRTSGESFGDYCNRLGVAQAAAIAGVTPPAAKDT